MLNSSSRLSGSQGVEGALSCLQAKYKISTDVIATITSKIANRLFHALGKDYFMLHKTLHGFIKVHSPFKLLITINGNTIKANKFCDDGPVKAGHNKGLGFQAGLEQCIELLSILKQMVSLE